MTLPPERITVKRRRDEDPIEALGKRKAHETPVLAHFLQLYHQKNTGLVLFGNLLATRTTKLNMRSL